MSLRPLRSPAGLPTRHLGLLSIFLCVAKQEMHSALDAGLLALLCNFRAAHRMRTAGARFQTDGRHPIEDDTRILAGRDVQSFMEPTSPEVFGSDHQRRPHPPCERGPFAFRACKAHGCLRLALPNRRALLGLSGRHDIHDLHLHQIATVQLAADGKIEKRKIKVVPSRLPPDPGCPDVFWLQSPFYDRTSAFVSAWAKRANGWQVTCCHD